MGMCSGEPKYLCEQMSDTDEGEHTTNAQTEEGDLDHWNQKLKK